MKLIVCALSFSLMLTACGGGKGPIRNDKKQNIDGIYFHSEQKFSNAADGAPTDSMIATDIYVLTIITDGYSRSYEIDPVEGKYTTFDLFTEVRGNTGTSVFEGTSCSEYDKAWDKAIGTKKTSTISVSETGLKVGTGIMLKIDDEQAERILNQLEDDYELGNDARSCLAQSINFGSSPDEETARSKLKEFLD